MKKIIGILLCLISSEIGAQKFSGEIIYVQNPEMKLDSFVCIVKESYNKKDTIFLRKNNYLFEIDSNKIAKVSLMNFSFLKKINTKDLLIIQRHILKFKVFEYWWQYIAADINQDYRVDIKDLVLLRKKVLGVNELVNEFITLHGEHEFQVPREEIIDIFSIDKKTIYLIQLGKME